VLTRADQYPEFLPFASEVLEYEKAGNEIDCVIRHQMGHFGVGEAVKYKLIMYENPDNLYKIISIAEPTSATQCIRYDWNLSSAPGGGCTMKVDFSIMFKNVAMLPMWDVVSDKMIAQCTEYFMDRAIQLDRDRSIATQQNADSRCEMPIVDTSNSTENTGHNLVFNNAAQTRVSHSAQQSLAMSLLSLVPM
jgi:ribosome-associated toxin RatA of RatAB toxin-antitoxin module